MHYALREAPMEQHPVPQQISSYEFRLIGDMTLKQFGLVAGGAVIALIFYSSPLPGFLKWPIILLSAFSGIAFAFLPFEERPLQTWVVAFLRAVYSPTQFFWHKRGQKPAFFEEESGKAVFVPPAPPTQPSEKISQYLAATSLGTRVVSEHEEEKFVENIQNLFATISTFSRPHQTVLEEKPVIGRMVPVKKKPQPVLEETTPRVMTRPLVLPKEESISAVLPRYAPRLPGRHTRQPFGQRAERPQFTPQIPLPSVPTIPNILVGMVVDPGGRIVEGAIIEIRDSQGSPVRAFKTNRLGQFRIVTPLPNDTYEVEIEKENLKFDIIKVSLKGDIVLPIEIKAKG